MTKKIYWLCDLLGVTGACLFLLGVYLVWSLWMVLIVSGLLLMAYACRLSYCLKHHDS